MQQLFSHHKPTVLRLNQLTPEAPELQDRLDAVNRDWSRGRSILQRWDAGLRKTLTNCQVRHHKSQIIKVPFIDLFSTVSFIGLGDASFPRALTLTADRL